MSLSCSPALRIYHHNPWRDYLPSHHLFLILSTRHQSDEINSFFSVFFLPKLSTASQPITSFQPSAFILFLFYYLWPFFLSGHWSSPLRWHISVPTSLLLPRQFHSLLCLPILLNWFIHSFNQMALLQAERSNNKQDKPALYFHEAYVLYQRLCRHISTCHSKSTHLPCAKEATPSPGPPCPLRVQWRKKTQWQEWLPRNFDLHLKCHIV